MYRRILICIILTLMTLATPFGSFTMATSNTVSWLQVSGINVVDGNGQRISPSGLDIAYGEYGESVTLADLETAKGLGFNSFRVNQVYWGLMQPYNETLSGIDAQYFSIGTPGTGTPLDSVVNMAVQEGMYVVICFNAWTGWYVPPLWAFPAISHVGSQVWAGNASVDAFTALINGTAAKERTGIVNTWKFIANRYRDIPNVLFELLNEPMVSDSSLAGNAYKNFNEQIISAIESTETHPHLKLVPFLRDSDWLEITNGAMDVSNPNVVWVSHHYVPWSSYDPHGTYWRDDSFTWHGQYFPAGWGNGSTYVAWTIIRLASQAHSWNRPWMVTEFSKPVNQAHYEDWFNAALTTMTEQQVAIWDFFCYTSVVSDEPGWNIANITTRQEMMPLLTPYMATSTSSTSVSSTSSVPPPLTLVTSTSTTTSTTSSSTSSTPTTSVSSSTSTVSAQMFTAVDSGQGSVTPNCPNGCSETVGSQVTVSASPASGWLFNGWSTQNGESCSSNPCTFNMPNNQVTLKPTFTQDPPSTQTLTTSVGSGQGTVNPNCPASSSCQGTVGQTITVTGTASSGWQFSSWSVTGASCSGGSSSNPCQFTMPNGGVSVSATFTDPQTLITGVDAGSGSVLPNCPSGCSEAVGPSITVQANPSSGWQFSGWSTQTGISCSTNPCTFSMPSNAVTLKATFTQLTQTSIQSSINGAQTVTVTQSLPPTTITNSVTVTQLVTQMQTVTQTLRVSNSVSASTSSLRSITSTTLRTTSSTRVSTSTLRSSASTVAKRERYVFYFPESQDIPQWWTAILLMLSGAWLALRFPRYRTGGLAIISKLTKASGRATSKP